MSEGLSIILALFSMSAVCVALLVLASNREASVVRTLFMAMVFCELVLFMATAMEMIFSDQDAKMLMSVIEVTFFSAIPLLVFLFAVAYTRWRKGIDRWLVLFLTIVPVIMLALFFTNDLHHLFYSDVYLIPADGYQMLYTEYETAFFVLYVYGRLATMSATLLVFRLYSATPRTQKRQAGIILVATAIPWLVTSGDLIFYLDGSYLTVVIDFVFLLLMSVLFYVGTFRFKLVDVTPLALDRLVEHLPEGVLVVEHEGAVAYASDRALAAMGRDKTIIGKRARDVLPAPLSSFPEAYNKGAQNPFQMELGERSFNVEIVDLTGEADKVRGHLLIMRDITEERATKEALRLANEKLNLLTMVARHDLVNKLSAAQGHVELGRLGHEAPAGQADRFNKMSELLRDMGAILDFSREYQKLGLESPTWQDVGAVVRMAIDQTHMDGIRTDVQVKGVEIYADLMLRTVFTNLMDNSLRHGGKVTMVRVSSSVGTDGSLTIVYEDDGIGIPDQDKERVFELGFGRNTGMGMYMARQILHITGCSIVENGKDGRGSRFEVRIPSARWRAPAS